MTIISINVLDMQLLRGRTVPGLALLAAAAVALAGCAATDGGSAPAGSVSSTADAGPACPQSPIEVTATIGPWGAIATEIGGSCAMVTTIIGSTAGDPHEYEPTPGDAAALTGARVVVVNGAGYDAWAQRVVETVDAGSGPTVVEAAGVVGAQAGANPHLWYDPAYVRLVAAAISAALVHAAPDAGAYLRERLADWTASLAPYDRALRAIKDQAADRPCGATEDVAEYLLAAAGLVDVTPPGWVSATANESDPSPGDLNAFLTALADGRMAVLVYNPQTEGPLPEQVREAAEAADVPVVEMTETLPPGAASFVTWQVEQLTALAAALDVTLP